MRSRSFIGSLLRVDKRARLMKLLQILFKDISIDQYRGLHTIMEACSNSILWDIL